MIYPHITLYSLYCTHYLTYTGKTLNTVTTEDFRFTEVINITSSLEGNVLHETEKRRAEATGHVEAKTAFIQRKLLIHLCQMSMLLGSTGACVFAWVLEHWHDCSIRVPGLDKTPEPQLSNVFFDAISCVGVTFFETEDRWKLSLISLQSRNPFFITRKMRHYFTNV